ncbi:hypothetical protein NAT51_06725 [Flavobacterium amniphilum]|uniref:hypothetical protein n=1 Tax=Flavobacterium amniphilum TaxID=1834035 RepID=UPI002029E84B|nr:hypothetical protein [Flavobacterium amniphilum]MCL9805206.1 hypothetical protein [Flavobacterium amniphilum]
MKKLLTLVFCFSFFMSNAQLLDLIKDKAKDKALNLGGDKAAKLLTKQAITTSFKDCDVKNTKPETFGNDKKYKELCKETFTAEGFLLKPGFYSFKAKSFCLKAGTHGPSKGDGYLYAPVKGPKEEIVIAIIKNWKENPKIEQTKVQCLLWAIIAHTKFKNLPTELQETAIKLLSKEQILDLTNKGLDFVPQNVMDNATAELPKPVRLVMEAENKIREFFNSSSSYNYQEIEKLAMLAGMNTETSEIQRGTWGLHPKGYYIAYLPNGYSSVEVHIYVPDTVKEVHYLPSDDVAVPASTGSQRLAISDMTYCNAK